MTKSVAGVIDRISLSTFAPGSVYDVDPSLAEYLISIDAAVTAASTAPAMVVLRDPLETQEEMFTGGISVAQSDVIVTAADRPTRRKPNRTSTY